VLASGRSEAWLSRDFWGVEIPGSNPGAPIWLLMDAGGGWGRPGARGLALGLGMRSVCVKLARRLVFFGRFRLTLKSCLRV
jgi:hypothetical protein